MSKNKMPEPFDQALRTFLTGSSSGETDIDPIFAKPFSRVLEEFRKFAQLDIEPDMKEPPLPSLLAEGYYYREVPAGILLYDQTDQPVGGYVSCDLSLAEEHQGRGLGAELVIERCLRDGENPVTNLDCAAYSPAGLGAHQAAWRFARAHPDQTRERYSAVAEENGLNRTPPQKNTGEAQ